MLRSINRIPWHLLAFHFLSISSGAALRAEETYKYDLPTGEKLTFENYSTEVETETTTFNELMDDATRLFKKRERLEALGVINRALELHPSKAEASNAFLLRGAIYFDLEQYQESIGDYKSAIDTDECPLRVQAHAYGGQATCYREMSQFGPAIACFSLAIKADPSIYGYRLARAICYVDIGDKRSAIEEIDSIIISAENEPDSKEKDQYLSVAYSIKAKSIYESGNYEDYVQLIEDALIRCPNAKSPAESFISSLIGRAARDPRDIALALTCAQKLVDAGGHDDWELLVLLGNAQLLNGDDEIGAETLRRSFDLAPHQKRVRVVNLTEQCSPALAEELRQRYR